MCVCVCACVCLCVFVYSAPRGQRRHGSPWRWTYRQLWGCGCWEQNSGPLQEQCTLTVPSHVSRPVPSFLSQGLPLNLELTHFTRLASEQALGKPPVCFHPTVLGLWMSTTAPIFFVWVLGRSSRNYVCIINNHFSSPYVSAHPSVLVSCRSVNMCSTWGLWQCLCV